MQWTKFNTIDGFLCSNWLLAVYLNHWFCCCHSRYCSVIHLSGHRIVITFLSSTNFISVHCFLCEAEIQKNGDLHLQALKSSVYLLFLKYSISTLFNFRWKNSVWSLQQRTSHNQLHFLFFPFPRLQNQFLIAHSHIFTYKNNNFLSSQLLNWFILKCCNKLRFKCTSNMCDSTTIIIILIRSFSTLQFNSFSKQ